MIGSKIDNIQRLYSATIANLGTLYDRLSDIPQQSDRDALESRIDDLKKRLTAFGEKVSGGISLPSVIPLWVTDDEQLYSEIAAMSADLMSMWASWSEKSGKAVPASVKASAGVGVGVGDYLKLGIVLASIIIVGIVVFRFVK